MKISSSSGIFARKSLTSRVRCITSYLLLEHHGGKASDTVQQEIDALLVGLLIWVFVALLE